MSWKSIIGQDRIKELFQGIIERDRLAHAYLFSGPDGVGKDAVAIELAKLINCERSRVESCDECPSCRRASMLQHPNIHLIFPLPVGKSEKEGDAPMAKLSEDEVKLVQEQLQAKSRNPYHPIALPRANMIKINSVREIRRDVALMSYSRGKKVFIITDAENLNDASSNALLKTLEEPPGDTLIILTTTYPDRLLPTILSRCQHVRFGPVSADAMEKALMERENIPAGEAHLVARAADGNYLRALQLMQADVGDRRDRSANFLRTILRGSRAEILGAIERLTSELEREDVEEFLMSLEAWLREALLLQEGGGADRAARADAAVSKFVSHYRGSNLGSAIDEIERAISLVNKNVYIPLVLITLAFKLQDTITAHSAGRHTSHVS